MDITDFANNQAWAIIPQRFEVLLKAFQDFKIDGLEVELANFRQAQGTMNDYRIINGVAIIPVSGPISKQSDLFSFLFGGSSIADLEEVFQTAMNDPAVDAVVLDIDSPGGTIGGLDAFSSMVFQDRATKPVVAFANGLMASAAYWIGSAAEAIVADRTAEIGSIGVLMVHYDFSENDRQYGLKRTFLTAGKYKALGNDAEPLSQEARDVFQAELGHLYSIFIDAVARNRDVDAETVQADMADGRIFIGDQAVQAGLVDTIGTMDTAISLARSMVEEKQYNRSGGKLPAGKEQNAMFKLKRGENVVSAPSNLDELTVMFPEIAAEIRDQGAQSVKIGEAVKTAATCEQERIMGFVKIVFGEEAGAKFAAVIASGVTAEQFSAITAMNPPAAAQDDAEEKKKAEMLAAIQAAGADNPGADGKVTVSGHGFMVKVEAFQTANKCTRTEAIRAIAIQDPDAHRDYIKHINKGGE
jgi:signal peptide peptidase SppA